MAQDATTKPPATLNPPRNGGIYVVAHRGAHDGVPENTLAAYQRAIDLGCDFVEIDVRTTKDGHLVSIHDSTIDRYTIDGSKGTVALMTLDEIRAVDIGSRIARKWADQRVPTVREIFELCRGKIGIYLDVKAASIESLASIASEFHMEQETLWYIPSSRVKALREQCPKAWPMPDPGPQLFLQKLLDDTKPAVVASTWKFFGPTFATQCHDNKAIVIVDEGGRESWEKLLEWGADGIQTDEPAELIGYLKTRTQANERSK